MKPQKRASRYGTYCSMKNFLPKTRNLDFKLIFLSLLSGQQIRLNLGQRQPGKHHRRLLHVGRRRDEARRIRRSLRR